MKRLAVIMTALLMLAGIMFAEYRYIMNNIKPYYAEDGYLYIDFMGQVDTYYAEPLFVEE